MFQVVWSSVVRVLFWCYPGLVVYISSILCLSVPGLLALPELLWLSYPKFFQFRFQGLYIFWQFFSYFNWSVLLSGDRTYQLASSFFLFILDCNVGSVGLFMMMMMMMMMMMVMLMLMVMVTVMVMAMMSIPCTLRIFGLVYSPWGGLQQVTTGHRSLFSFFLKEQHFP